MIVESQRESHLRPPFRSARDFTSPRCAHHSPPCCADSPLLFVICPALAVRSAPAPASLRSLAVHSLLLLLPPASLPASLPALTPLFKGPTGRLGSVISLSCALDEKQQQSQSPDARAADTTSARMHPAAPRWSRVSERQVQQGLWLSLVVALCLAVLSPSPLPVDGAYSCPDFYCDVYNMWNCQGSTTHSTSSQDSVACSCRAAPLCRFSLGFDLCSALVTADPVLPPLLSFGDCPRNHCLANATSCSYACGVGFTKQYPTGGVWSCLFANLPRNTPLPGENNMRWCV